MATNYTALINRAIAGFDSVFSELSKKELLLTSAQIACQSGHEIDVSQYGTYIKKLASIKDKDGNLWSAATLTGAILYVGSGETKTLTPVSTNPVIKDEDGKYLVTFNPDTVAYYGTGSILQGTLNTESFTFATDNASYVKYVPVTGSLGSYVISSKTDIFGEITVKEGKASVAFEDFSVTGLKTEINSLSAVADGGIINLSELAKEAAKDTTNFYYFTVSAGAQASGKITANVSASTTEGYVQTGTVAVSGNADYTIPEAINDSDSKVYAIPKGSVKVDAAENSSAKAAIDLTAGSVDIFTNKETSIGLVASVSGITLKGTFTEGYVVEGDELAIGNVSVPNSETLYVKVGAIGDQEVEINNVEDVETVVKGSLSILAASAGTNTTDITLTTDVAKAVSVTPGFISGAGEAKVKVTGTNTLHIKNASGAKAEASITDYDISGDESILDENGAYSITVTPSVSIESGLTDIGLLLDKDDITVSDATQEANKSYTLRFAAGSATISDIDFVMSGTLVDADGINDTIEFGNLFKTVIPTGRDYFTVKSSASLSTTAGFIGDSNAQTVGNLKEKIHYVPKAVVEWVKSEDSTEEYLEVKEAGYLPSGILNDIIFTNATKPDPAVVTLKATPSLTGLLHTETESGKNYHSFEIAKHGVDAGYISDLQGSLANTTYYIEKGSVSGTPNATVTSTGITRADDGSQYTFALKADIAHNITVAPGYITASEVNIGALEGGATGTHVVKRATFNEVSHTTELATSGSNVAQDSTKTSAYVITPSITKCESSFKVAQEGYISSADNSLLAFNDSAISHVQTEANKAASKFYIKAGNNGSTTPYTLTKESGVLSVENLDEEDGTISDYTLIVGGTLTATTNLEIGYYGEAEKAIRGNLEVSKEITIAHGHVTSSIKEGSANAIAAVEGPNALVLHSKADKEADTTNKYSVIRATANVSSTTTVTEGYIKNIPGDITEGSTALTAESYVKLYESGNVTEVGAAEGKENWSVSIGQKTEELPTAPYGANEKIYTVIPMEERYSKKDTTVILSAHAMGTAVANELLALESRLAGFGAKA